MLAYNQIKHLAKLSMLKLTEEEIESLTNDLNKILKYVDKINELDLKELEPLINILEKLSWRDDFLKENEFDKNILKENFLEKENSYLKVPKILEK